MGNEGDGEQGERRSRGSRGSRGRWEDEEDEEVNSKLYLTCSLFPIPCSLTND